MTFYNKNISGGKDRRSNDPATAADRTDENLPDRLIKCTEVLTTTAKKKLTYKISLRFLVTKFIFTLETDKNRLIETNTLASAIIATDAAILWHDR